MYLCVNLSVNIYNTLKRESAARQRANQSSEQNEHYKRQCRESKGRKIMYDASAELTQSSQILSYDCIPVEPPTELKSYLIGDDKFSQEFHQNIYAYNSTLAFIFMEAKINYHITGIRSPYTFHIHGEIHYNIPSTSEVATIIVDDNNNTSTICNHDIILYSHDKDLQGDGWHLKISICDKAQLSFFDVEQQYNIDDTINADNIDRPEEGINLHLFEHLFQQYIIDAYANVKQNQLNYLKCNQKKIYADLYIEILEHENTSETILTAWFKANAWFSARTLLSSNYTKHSANATSFDHLRTVNNVLYPTFKDICEALGLLQNNKKWDNCLNKAQQIQSGLQIYDNILYQTHLEAESNPSYTFTESDIYNIALTRLEAILIRNRFHLTDFPNMSTSKQNLKILTTSQHTDTGYTQNIVYPE
ncbi:10595_t:CDS:10, partial [Cetraspora pellucida]